MARVRKLPAVKGGSAGCLNCGYAQPMLPKTWGMDNCWHHATISMNRGKARQLCAGKAGRFHVCPIMRLAEAQVLAHGARHDWRVNLVTAMHDETYQRQGRRKWVLVKRGMGYV